MGMKKSTQDRERLAASLAASLPDSGGEYLPSSALSSLERRKLLGLWEVFEHSVGGLAYLESFAAIALRGALLHEPAYAALYDFRDALCVKKVQISGYLDLPEGRSAYAYRMSMAISWELGRGCLFVRPELGYQSTSLGGSPAAVREFGSSGERLRIDYHFEGELLVLEEGEDRKLLKRGSR